MTEIDRKLGHLTLEGRCTLVRIMKSTLSDMIRALAPDGADESELDMLIYDHTSGNDGDIATAKQLLSDINVLKLKYSKAHFENILAKHQARRQHEARYAAKQENRW
jgi:hypothetical protein